MRRTVWMSRILVLLAGILAVACWVLSWRPAAWKNATAAERVAAIRAGSVGVNRLLEALKDEDADVRLVAVMHVQGRGLRGQECVPALIRALKDPHAGVRHEAAESLCWIGKPAVQALCEALLDPDPHVRAGAALALGDVDDKDRRDRSPDEVRTLQGLLKDLLADKDPEVRKNAAETLNDLKWHQR